MRSALFCTLSIDFASFEVKLKCQTWHEYSSTGLMKVQYTDTRSFVDSPARFKFVKLKRRCEALLTIADVFSAQFNLLEICMPSSLITSGRDISSPLIRSKGGLGL